MEIAGDAGVVLGKGAIVGALVVSAGYLAGYAVLKRSGAAACALLMIAAAAALEFGRLGLFTMTPKIAVLLQGVFGAAAVIYVSSVARLVRNNAIIGGVMLAAAVTLAGIGIMNLVGPGDASGLMRLGLISVGVFAALLGVFQWSRDPAVRLLLPGVALAGLAPILAAYAGASPMIASTLFAIGVIAASLVAMTQENLQRVSELGLHEHGHRHSQEMAASFAVDPRECEADADGHSLLSETQLAKVMDYAGVAVWDWCPHGAHQTDSMPTLMGADSRAPFTPEAIRAFIHKDDLAKLETRILAPSLGDGSFDQVLKLHDGRSLRFRGARAVDSAGQIERLVAFIETAPDAVRSRFGSPAPATAALAAAAQRPVLQHNSPSAPSAPQLSIGEAIAKGEISAVFQPIVSLDNGKVAGFETLARWPGRAGEPDRASAEDLVRAAEAAGKGGALARLILNEAAQFLAREIKTHGKRDVFVALNLSFAQMRDAGFPAALKKAMSEHHLPPKSLVLELTESQAIQEKGAAETFKALRDAGAALAFDDFGSGFSSLSNLRKYSFDYLKIDKSFVDGLVKGNESGKIAQAIAALGKDLGLTVIAEGVETRETADAARRIGCTLAQGYAFGAPSRAAEPAAKPSDARSHSRQPELAGASVAAGASERKARGSMWRGGLR
ncbi:MAG: EAL domain-containing protein [Parvularculaceae bacterium]|nr:EAL domain-containing protein [Parvularculaceae bacterium]